MKTVGNRNTNPQSQRATQRVFISRDPHKHQVSEQEALKVCLSKPVQTCLCVLSKVKQEAAPELCCIQTILRYQRQTHAHTGVCLALRVCVYVSGWNDCVQIKTFLLAQLWEITFTVPQPRAEPSPDHQRSEHALPRSQHFFCLSLSLSFYHSHVSHNCTILFQNLVNQFRLRHYFVLPWWLICNVLHRQELTFILIYKKGFHNEYAY